jgi:hypothetical protein
MVAIGQTYQKIYLPTQPYIGITNSGALKVCLKSWWGSYILKSDCQLKKTEVDYIDDARLTSSKKYL